MYFAMSFGFCFTLVFLLFCCFLLIVDAFDSVQVCNPDLLTPNRFMSFENSSVLNCDVAFIRRITVKHRCITMTECIEH